MSSPASGVPWGWCCWTGYLEEGRYGATRTGGSALPGGLCVAGWMLPGAGPELARCSEPSVCVFQGAFHAWREKCGTEQMALCALWTPLLLPGKLRPATSLSGWLTEIKLPCRRYMRSSLPAATKCWCVVCTSSCSKACVALLPVGLHLSLLIGPCSCVCCCHLPAASHNLAAS